MFKQIAALLRPKPIASVEVADFAETPVKRKPSVKKATTHKFAAKPTVKTVAKTAVKKPAAKKTVAKKK